MRWLGLIFFFAFAPTIHAQAVAFGEKHPADTLTGIYFDKDGMIYPDFPISNAELKAVNTSLIEWYNRHPKTTDSLLQRYQISTERISYALTSNTYTDYKYPLQSLELLNEKLIEAKTNYLDSLGHGNGLEFYIHGFRKSYIENGQDVTSVTEFSYLKNALDSSRTRKNLIINVYWDGTYDCCFSSNFKRNRELFELYETAGHHADKVSISFSKLLQNCKTQNINIVAHSLGTKVVVQGVMYCEKDFHHFRVCLLEPAISGEFFKQFYDGTTQIPNRSWLISYNENDFVLKKKDNKIGVFGPGAYKYGETTLGCNKNRDAEKLQKWMAINQPLVEFELVDKSYIGKHHSLRKYTKSENLTEVSTFLENK